MLFCSFACLLIHLNCSEAGDIYSRLRGKNVSDVETQLGFEYEFATIGPLKKYQVLNFATAKCGQDGVVESNIVESRERFYEHWQIWNSADLESVEEFIRYHFSRIMSS